MSDVDFYAQSFGDYWTIQVLCVTPHRHYVVRKSDGAMFELPDDRVPFVVIEPPTEYRWELTEAGRAMRGGE